jgi:hypothetical protein
MTFQEAAVQAAKEHGMRMPSKDLKVKDLTWVKRLATRPADPDRKYGPQPYRPEAPQAKLHLKEAIYLGMDQAAYADHAYYAIPVTVAEGADLKSLSQNLARIANAARTTNGYAGYGSTFDFYMHRVEDHTFVILNQRSSIAD